MQIFLKMASEKGEFRKRGEIPKKGGNQPRLMPLEIEIYISLQPCPPY